MVASHGADVHRSFHPQLSPRYVQGLEAQKNFLRDHGFLKGDFSVPESIDPRPLAVAQKLVENSPAFTAGGLPHTSRVEESLLRETKESRQSVGSPNV